MRGGTVVGATDAISQPLSVQGVRWVSNLHRQRSISGGSQIVHGRQRRYCGGGSGICQHGRQRHRCEGAVSSSRGSRLEEIGRGSTVSPRGGDRRVFFSFREWLLHRAAALSPAATAPRLRVHLVERRQRGSPEALPEERAGGTPGDSNGDVLARPRRRHALLSPRPLLVLVAAVDADWGVGEDGPLGAVRLARQLPFVLLARPLDEDEVRPANLLLLPLRRGGPERVDDLGEPALLDVLGHVVLLVTRRGRAVALE